MATPWDKDWLAILGPFETGSINLGRYPTHEMSQMNTPEEAYRELKRRRAASTMTDEEKRRRKACPGKPLKLSGSCLTGYEGSPCKQIEPVSVKWIESEVEPEWFGATDLKNDNGGSYVGVKFKPNGIDTDKFRKECLEDEG